MNVKKITAAAGLALLLCASAFAWSSRAQEPAAQPEAAAGVQPAGEVEAAQPSEAAAGVQPAGEVEEVVEPAADDAADVQVEVEEGAAGEEAAPAPAAEESAPEAPKPE